MTAEMFYETCLANLDAMALDMQSAVVSLHAVVCIMCAVCIYTLFWGRRR